MTQTDLYDVIILGSGPAGLTAAIYTARAKLKTLVISGFTPGGQLTTTTKVENFPGFPEGIYGPELMNRTMDQAKNFGASFVFENVSSLSGTAKENFTVTTDSNNTYTGRTLIIATGVSPRWLGLPNEQKLRGRGVCVCATCDAAFFKDQTVAVIGGGDTAMEEATFLTKFASKVYLVVREDKSELRASKYMQDLAFANDKIIPMFNIEVQEILGEKSVEGIKIHNLKTDDTETLDISGMFVAIGSMPNTTFLMDFIELDERGHVKITNNTQTSKPGVFVAGDVSDPRYRQAITAAGFGAMAAIDAESYLANASQTE